MWTIRSNGKQESWHSIKMLLAILYANKHTVCNVATPF